MGPLVPFGFIGNEFNYIIALVIGFFFGYILESAGFSNSRKLAGVFYGYDFVVLKVFFTAAVTAMIGLIFLSYFGWLDMSVVYINPLYLWPAIVGGAIMGVGFIIGGFCPGTSITAASIGRIDGIVFVMGIMAGVFLFAEGFDFYKDFYTSSAMGSVRVFDSLGISQGTFAFALIVMAVVAFAITSKIEKNVAAKYQFNILGNQPAKTGIATILMLVLGVIILFIPEKEVTTFEELSATELRDELVNENHFIHVDEVAFHLMNDIETIDMQLIDVRSEEEFREFSLPGAINIPLEKIASKQMTRLLLEKNEKVKTVKVFFSNGNTKADKAWLYFRRMEQSGFKVMEGGLNNFVKTIFVENTEVIDIHFLHQHTANSRFRNEAKMFFQGMEKEVKTSTNTEVPTINTIKVAGGC